MIAAVNGSHADFEPYADASSAVSPPHSLEAEQAALGAILMAQSPDTFIVEYGLQPTDFYRDRHQVVFQAMLDLHADSEPIDHLTVTEHLRSAGRLDEAGGAPAIVELLTFVPAGAHLRKYAAIVKEYGLKRRLLDTTYQLQAAIHGHEADALTLLERGVETLDDLALTSGAKDATFKLLDTDALAALPAVTYLVDRILPEGQLTVPFGPSGVGKTFVVLDLLLSIATGTPWHGHPVKQGKVVYLAGEGSSTLDSRISAWRKSRGDTGPGPVPGFTVIPVAFSLLDAANLQKLKRTLRVHGHFDVLAVDTLARYMTGGDENSAQDMGRFIAAVDAIRVVNEPMAAGVVVHHTGKDQDRDERGSNALEGAADCRIKVTGKQGSLTIKCLKMKGDVEFDTLAAKLVPAHGSLVLGLVDTDKPWKPTGLMEKVSRALEEHGPLGTNQLKDIVRGSNEHRPKAIDELVHSGHISRAANGSQGLVHTLITPYRSPDPEPIPDRSPGPAETTGPPIPLPVGGIGSGAQDQDHHKQTNRSRGPEAHVTAQSSLLGDSGPERGTPPNGGAR